MITLFFSGLFSRKTASVRTNLISWKVLAAALLFSCLAFSGSASAQTAQWVKQMGLGGISNGVSSDAAGNAYATGIGSNPGLFDNLTIPCNASDVFLAKYDTSGKINGLRSAAVHCSTRATMWRLMPAGIPTSWARSRRTVPTRRPSSEFYSDR